MSKTEKTSRYRNLKNNTPFGTRGTSRMSNQEVFEWLTAPYRYGNQRKSAAIYKRMSRRKEKREEQLEADNIIKEELNDLD